MRRNRPEESGSLSSIPKDESQFTIGSSGGTGLRDTLTASGVVVAAVLFSRLRYGQLCIVVRGQDVGCGCGWWQHDLLCVPETCPSGHAIAGQTVAMLNSITAITNATAVLIIIIEVDVPNRILVGNILHSPKDKCIKNSRQRRTIQSKARHYEACVIPTVQAAAVRVVSGFPGDLSAC